MLVETQILIGTPGAYRVSRPPLSIQVPATVQAVLAARIDRLPAEEKHLLQCAAVIGTEVPFALLQAVAQMPEGELHRSLAHLPESRDTLEQGIDLRMDLRTALLPLDEFRRLHDLLREAVPLAEALGDQRRLRRISDRLCHASWQMGNYKAAIEFGQQALAIGIALGDVFLQLPTNVNLACAYHALGDYGPAITCCRTAVSLEGVLPPPPTSPTGRNDVNARAGLSQCLAELGMFEDEITHGEEAIRMAEARDHPCSRASAYGSLGHLYLRQWDLRKAISLLKRGIELCQVWQIQFYFPHVASPLGLAYALSGQAVEAMALLERAVEQSVAMRFIPYISRGLAALSEANLIAGRLDEAAPLALRALDVAQRHQEQGNHAWAVRLLGQIAAQRNPPDVEQAEEHYHQALVPADTLGMRPLMAHCHRGLGMLYAEIGRREQAGAELSTAIELYRDMGMTFWLPQAEAVLAQMGG
jgi:tetratricopeptide (TPR) repeat protein